MLCVEALDTCIKALAVVGGLTVFSFMLIVSLILNVVRLSRHET